jgi:hypothetical protein
MAANNALIVTDLDYDKIKSNLTAFLSNQTDFRDYDFESSGMQTIISLLAYNTYYNSIYTNMASNETFLDTALIRNNVVSRAKALGYTPTSARGARATLRVTLTPTGNPASVVAPANTQFTTTLEGIQYIFNSVDSVTFTRNANSAYIANMVVREGDPVQESYTVNSLSPARYLLNNSNCDTESLKVSVQQSVANTSIQVFNLADSIASINGNSAVYFLQEGNDGAFEVVFGDNVLGKKPIDGNIVRLNYNVCNGPIVNGTKLFTGPASIGGVSTYSIAVASKASGGSNPQSIDSIKFTAPKTYQAQNRAVTIDDYKAVLLKQAPDLQAVSVWGGENNSPPVYGKVFISAKPRGDVTITKLRKQELVDFLKDKNLVTIQPEFVDPTYLFIVPKIEIQYDPSTTTKNAGTLLAQVESTLSNFNNTKLSIFNSNYYESTLTDMLNEIDDSVMAVSIDSTMQKRFIPDITKNTKYTLLFNNELYYPHPGHKFAISSSSFTHQGYTCYFDDDGYGVVRIYRMDKLQRIYVNSNAGTIDYETGLLQINALRITSYEGDAVKVIAQPRLHNIKAYRNQIMQLADATIDIKNSKTLTTEALSTSVAATTIETAATETGQGSTLVAY